MTSHSVCSGSFLVCIREFPGNILLYLGLFLGLSVFYGCNQNWIFRFKNIWMSFENSKAHLLQKILNINFRFCLQLCSLYGQLQFVVLITNSPFSRTCGKNRVRTSWSARQSPKKVRTVKQSICLIISFY